MYTHEQRRTMARIRRAGYQIMSATQLDGGRYRLVLRDDMNGKDRAITLKPSGSYTDDNPLARKAI